MLMKFMRIYAQLSQLSRVRNYLEVDPCEAEGARFKGEQVLKGVGVWRVYVYVSQAKYGKSRK